MKIKKRATESYAEILKGCCYYYYDDKGFMDILEELQIKNKLVLKQLFEGEGVYKLDINPIDLKQDQFDVKN
jgi:hypothetical protein